MAVNNREILLRDGTALPNFSQFTGNDRIFRDQNNATGFPVEPMNQMRLYIFSQVQTNAADEAGILVALRRMANQTSRFIDYQQVFVFLNDVEEFFHQIDPFNYLT